MKNFLIGLFTFIGTTGISAQTQSITVHSQTTGKEEIIDVPESMQFFQAEDGIRDVSL